MTTGAHLPSSRPGARRRGWPGWLCRVALVAGLTYLAVCAAVFVFQGRLLYFPTERYDRTPPDLHLPYESVTLTAADGVGISAWYLPCEGARGTILFCHGNAGNMADRLPTAWTLRELGYHVLLFDYRGYGSSGGHPGERGSYLDAQAAWRYLVERRGVSPHRVVVFGRSLGGAVAVDLASRHRPGALVVEASFTRLADVGAVHYPLLPVRLLCRLRYDSARKVPGITCPKLFIHARDDELVPFQIGRRLFEAAPPPKRFLATPGGHNTGGFLYSPVHVEKLASFLGDALGETAP